MKSTFLFAALLLNISQLPAQSVNNHSMHFSQNGFVQNTGQFYDEHGKLNGQIEFLFAKDDFHLVLKPSGFSYELILKSPQVKGFPESGISDPEDMEDWRDDQSTQVSVSRIDISLVGANRHPVIIADQNTGTLYNYYLGKRVVVNVPSYHRITYQNVYPGIDMVFEDHHSENGDVPEYSFIVHPGGDVHQIKMEYTGATNMSLEEQQHTLSMAMPNGLIKETGLKGYWLEDGSVSGVSFHLKNGLLSFNAAVNKNKTLVIDPSIVWGSYFGGKRSDNWDTESEITLDSANNVFISGSTYSSKFIATTGSVMPVYAGQRDMFLAKFSSDGTQVLWATYFGGSGMDVAYGVCCDSRSNVLITGFTESPDVMTTPGVFQDTLLGKSDVLIAKFSNTGQLVWSTLMGGASDSVEHEHGRGIICDAQDHIYVCGYALSNTNISTTGAYQKKIRASGDAFLVKFDSTGQKIWGTYFGGGGKDRAHAICLDRFGHVYFVGTTKSKKTIAVNGFQTTIGGKTDAMIAKFDSAGHFYWSSYYGGSGEERCRGVKCDGDGNIYFVGWTASSDTNVISTPNSFQQNRGGNDDGFLVKFTPSGGRIWGTYFGGSQTDFLYGLTIDSLANIYLCGSTSSGGNIASEDALQPVKSSLKDGLIAEFDSSGNRIWSTYFGGPGYDEAFDIEINNSGSLYLDINSDSTLPVTAGAYQTTVRGEDDLAVFMFNLNTDSSGLKGSKTLQALSDFHLKIYPNPSPGIITAELQSGESGYTRLNVFDVSGKIVFSRMVAVKEGTNTFYLDLSALNSGNYLLGETGSAQSKTLSFTIEK
ncbi:MAG TPA: SBBP repeat-containing protein [Chitinophagales bacterium]|nr:SBBP repeat-containing protein [Chitinophagales bacterium]